MGFRPARLFALTSALLELGGGLLLAARLLTPFVADAWLHMRSLGAGRRHRAD